MSKSKRILFKRKDQQPGTAADAPATNPAVADEDILHWSVRTFFDQLFKVSVDDVSIEQARSNFALVASHIKALSQEDRAEVLKQTDFFVGRVRANLEPVLVEWYKANR